MQIKPSKSSEWRTPDWLFKRFDEMYSFDLDACADKDNHLCSTFYDIDRKYENRSALEIAKEHSAIFCNPPYDSKSLTAISTHLIHVCQYARDMKKRVVAVLLCPCKTDQEWWSTCCYFATKIAFVRGRLRFSGSKDSAQQSHAVFTFDSFCLGHRKIEAIIQPDKNHDKPREAGK